MVTVINTEDFRTVSADSIKRGYNRLPSDELLEKLDPEGTHVMTFNMPHEHIYGELDPDGGHVRTMWDMKLTGEDKAVTVFLDMTWENFNSLARLQQNADGEWVRVEREIYGMGLKLA